MGIDLLELTDWLGLDFISVDLERRRIAHLTPSGLGRLGMSAEQIQALELRGPALEAVLEHIFLDADARAQARDLLDAPAGREVTFEYRARRPDGERWRRAVARIVAGPNGRRLDLVSHDITDLVQVREAAVVADTLRELVEAVHRAPTTEGAAAAAAEVIRGHLAVDRCAIIVFADPSSATAGPALALPADRASARARELLRLHGPLHELSTEALEDEGERAMFAAIGLRRIAFAAVGAGTSPLAGISIGSRLDRPFTKHQRDFLARAAEVLVGPLAQKALDGERARAAAQLAAAEERLRAALDASSTGIWELDVPSQKIRWDARCFAIWEFDPAGGPQREATMARVHPEDRDTLRRLSAEAADPAGDGNFRVEYRYEAPSGLRWIAARGRYHFDAEGRPARFIGTVHDVSEARRLEQKLVAAQKTESLGVLAGGIAHDFNNLLVGVLGNAGLAKLELPPNSPVLESIEGIETAAVRASELTRQLLAYAGKGRFVISRIDLERLVVEMGHLLQAVIGKGVVLRYQFGRGIPPIEGDATQLRQVVMNLITNASDAIGDRSGIITVATSLIEADQRYLEETLFDHDLVPGYYICLQVSDTGIGMDAETQARIFEPFFTTKFTGRGLGLAAVLGILRSHRGSMKVYSEPGRGTTFKVLLPATDGSVDLPAETQRTPTVGTGTVLVIDDEETVRSVTKRILEHAHYRVLTANDGVDGVAAFRAHRGEIIAVVLDVTMPRMGGEETFRQLRLIDPDVRVLLASGYSEQEATSQFAGKGLAGFVEKPFQPHVLLERLAQALRAG